MSNDHGSKDRTWDSSAPVPRDPRLHGAPVQGGRSPTQRHEKHLAVISGYGNFSFLNQGATWNSSQADSHPSRSFKIEQQSGVSNYDDPEYGLLLPLNTHMACALPDMGSWTRKSLASQPLQLSEQGMHSPQTMQPSCVPESHVKKEAKTDSEKCHQKAPLSQQIEDYTRKAGILREELGTLREQRHELRGDGTRSPSPDTKRFLKENTKLQLDIQNKLKTIDNMLDMLKGINGEESQDMHDPEVEVKSRSPQKFNYVYYDPEIHWCRVCNEFPLNAREYLTHLHSPQHQEMAAQHKEAPWHGAQTDEGLPSYPAAPCKRIPIRGLQFFVPSTAWYCKLCDQFIGDLHCASAHLKSQIHSKNYANYVEQNPHWETDWMSDRQRAFQSMRASNLAAEEPSKSCVQYTSHTITYINKEEASPRKRINKKRNSGGSRSSTSDSEQSGSEEGSKKTMIKEEVDREERWSTGRTDRLTDSDRKLLDSLKYRINKARHRSSSIEKERIAEMQRKIRECERRGYPETRDKREESARQERSMRSNSRGRRSSDRRNNSRDRRTRDHRETSRCRDRRGHSVRRSTDWQSRGRRSKDGRDTPRSRDNTRDRRDRSTDSRDKQRDRSRSSDTKERHVSTPTDHSQKESPPLPPPEAIPLPESQPTTQATTQPTTQLVTQPFTMPVNQPTTQLVTQPTPATQYMTQLASQPLTQPVTQVPTQFMTQPVSQVVPQLGSQHVQPMSATMPPSLQAMMPQGPLADLAMGTSSLQEFQEALTQLFPTDPEKCAEMLNTMHQPGLLGPAPGLFNPFMPAGMFGFNVNMPAPIRPAGLRAPTFFPPPMMPVMPHLHKPRLNLVVRPKSNKKIPKRPIQPKRRNQQVKSNVKPQVAAEQPSVGQRIPPAVDSGQSKEELAMLGIDASDVGAI